MLQRLSARYERNLGFCLLFGLVLSVNISAKAMQLHLTAQRALLHTTASSNLSKNRHELLVNLLYNFRVRRSRIAMNGGCISELLPEDSVCRVM